MNILLMCNMVLLVVVGLSTEYMCASQRQGQPVVVKQPRVPRLNLPIASSDARGSHQRISRGASAQKDKIRRSDSNDGDCIIHDQKVHGADILIDERNLESLLQ